MPVRVYSVLFLILRRFAHISPGKIKEQHDRSPSPPRVPILFGRNPYPYPAGRYHAPCTAASPSIHPSPVTLASSTPGRRAGRQATLQRAHAAGCAHPSLRRFSPRFPARPLCPVPCSAARELETWRRGSRMHRGCIRLRAPVALLPMALAPGHAASHWPGAVLVLMMTFLFAV